MSARTIRLAAGVGLALALVLLVAAILRPSSESAHLIRIGSYSPFRVAYLSALVAVIAAALAAVRGGRLGPGLAMFVVGLATAVSSAAILAGYVEAVLANDMTLVRLPPSDQTDIVALAAISFARVTLVFLLALAAGVLVAVAAVQKRREDLVTAVTRWCVVLAVAVRDAMAAGGRVVARWPRVVFGGVGVLLFSVYLTGIRVVAPDAAQFWVFGRIILDGGLPYRDYWDVKFPGIHYISAAFELLERGAQSLGVPFGVTAALAETGVMALTLVVFHRLAREFVDGRVALGLTALFALIANDPIMVPGGHLTETYVHLPGLLASLCAVRVLRGGGSVVAPLGVGVWSAAASMIRPPALLPLAVFLLVVWIGVLRRNTMAPARALRVSSLALGGFALTWGALLAYFASRGVLGDFLEVPIAFNAYVSKTYAMSMRLAQAALTTTYVGILLPALVAAIVLVVRSLAGRWRTGLDLRLLFLVLLATFELLAMLTRGYSPKYNYLAEAVPAFCVLVAVGLGSLRAPQVMVPRGGVAVVGALLIFHVAAGYALYLLRPQAIVVDRESMLPAASYIREHTRPGERVFVITGNPETMHYHADRLPVSRYLYLDDSMVAYTHGEAPREILRDLIRRPPSLVLVDMMRRRQAPVERDALPYIERHYVAVGTLVAPRATYQIYRPR